MPTCKIKLCGKSSTTSSIRKDGITFHRFPKCLNQKIFWVEVTQQPENWIPTKSSVICSRHFKPECFKYTKNNRRLLFESAVPTLFIPKVEPDTDSNISNAVVTASAMPTPKSIEYENDDVVLTDLKGISMPSTSYMDTTDDVQTNIPSNFSSPRKRRLRSTIIDLTRKLKTKNIKLKRLQNATRVLKKKVCTLQTLLKELQSKELVNDEHISVLSHLGVKSAEIMKRQIMNAKSGKISRMKYSPELRSFALTLHFYSSKAYEYVRKTFHTCLPSPKTISKWYKTVDGRPGFTEEAFEAIRMKSEYLGKKLFGTLIFDEMKINNDVEINQYNHREYGYVDFGGEIDTDCVPECTEALVFLVVPFNASFKVPIGYFLANKINAHQKKTLVTQAIRLCKDVNFIIKAVTFDGCPTNTSMARKLGCELDPPNLKTTFNVDDMEIAIFLDPVHMVKLVRNSFEFYRDFKDRDGNIIQWAHIQTLHELQENESFHMANKLRAAHLHFKNNKMKVKLATQIFSRSVSTALLFCKSELMIPEFQDVEGTANMLLIINDLFDILDSKTHGYGLKRAINKENYSKICQRMEEAKGFLQTVRVSDTSTNPEKNLKLVDTKRFTGFVGLCVCIESAKFIFKELIEGVLPPMTYLPLHKTSQDHIELFFCNMRSGGGANNNPTPLQFEGIYKKMLVHTELQQSRTGNCVPLENISILNCSSAVSRINLTTARNNNTSGGNHEKVEDDELAVELQETSFSLFAENIIEYIAGFVVRSLKKKIKCHKCVEALMSNTEKQTSLIFARDKGGLIYPSETVTKICRFSEIIIRNRNVVSNVKPDRRLLFLTTKILGCLLGENLFPDLLAHQYEQEATNNHIIDLTKCVIEKYTFLRLAYLTKKKQPLTAIRRIYTKLIHFKNQ